MATVNLTIDGRKVSADTQATILEAAKQLNIYIPTLCHLDMGELKYVNQSASCRICVVEVEGRRNLALPCATVGKAWWSHKIQKRVLRARRKVLELFFPIIPLTA